MRSELVETDFGDHAAQAKTQERERDQFWMIFWFSVFFSFLFFFFLVFFAEYFGHCFLLFLLVHCRFSVFFGGFQNVFSGRQRK